MPKTEDQTRPHSQIDTEQHKLVSTAILLLKASSTTKKIEKNGDDLLFPKLRVVPFCGAPCNDHLLSSSVSCSIREDRMSHSMNIIAVLRGTHFFSNFSLIIFLGNHWSRTFRVAVYRI